jgi:hypothetical protein
MIATQSGSLGLLDTVVTPLNDHYIALATQASTSSTDVLLCYGGH